MFNKILIKSGSNVAERYLSIADVVDMMFYFTEVHVVISQFELKQLLAVFGEDIFYELITSKRLIAHLCDQHIGSSRYGELDSVGLFRHNFHSFDELLFNFHKETTNDFKENKRFAERFSKVLSEYRYPKEINDSLYKDVENEDLLSKVTQVFIKQYYPNYRNVEDIHIKADPSASSFMTFYKIGGNLRINELNEMHYQNGYSGAFGYSTILMALGETHMDCYLASELQAEMMVNQRWSEVYKLRINESIKQIDKTIDDIDHFHEMTANDYLSPGQSFVDGLITPKELVNSMNCDDSIKFREWLSKIPQGQPISGELYKAIQNQNSNKLWVKGIRTFAQVVTGSIPIVGPFVGGALTFLDGFAGDKIINGWQPSMFVNRVLTKDQFKK